MGEVRSAWTGGDQPVHVKLRRDDYARLKYYLMRKGAIRGGVTAFIQEAVRRYLQVVEAEPTTFEDEFMRMWGRPPRALDKWCCYGAAIDRVEQGVIMRQVGRFTIPELQQHHDTSRWDERTYVLVDEQIKRHRESGLAWNEQRTLIPPVPMAVIDEPVTHSPPQPRPIPADADLGASPFDFDPRAKCFLGPGACPQLETCAEAKGCCADPPQEEDIT